MKLVVFALTPPPLHGQSYMTELLLNGLAANDYGIQVFHVNAQFSESSADIGRFRPAKILRREELRNAAGRPQQARTP